VWRARIKPKVYIIPVHANLHVRSKNHQNFLDPKSPKTMNYSLGT